MVKEKLQVLSLSYFAKEYYGPWLQKMPVKVIAALLSINTNWL